MYCRVNASKRLRINHWVDLIWQTFHQPTRYATIEVTFDIDANGILNVSAKDKATGKAQSIVIKASSGLAEEEIERMVQDAKSHAEEDRKFKEVVDLRNTADSTIHNTEKTIKDLGDKVSADDKSNAESAIADLKEALKGSDKDAIQTKVNALTEISSKIGEQVYKQQAESAGAGQQQESTAKKEEGVVDAEFEEVNKDKDKDKDEDKK